MGVFREYTNGEITVVWDAEKCTHSGRCVRGLPEVFDLKAKPWVNVLGGSSEEIGAQVDRCPSGALSWYRNDGLDGKTG